MRYIYIYIISFCFLWVFKSDLLLLPFSRHILYRVIINIIRTYDCSLSNSTAGCHSNIVCWIPFHSNVDHFSHWRLSQVSHHAVKHCRRKSRFKRFSATKVKQYVYICIYMRQCTWSALVQIMACHMFGDISHYLNQHWLVDNWALMNKLQWNFNQNTKWSIHENAHEMSSAKRR